MSRANYLDNHYIYRSNWLRAAVLGANDGIYQPLVLLLALPLRAMKERQSC